MVDDEIRVLKHRIWCKPAEKKTLWEIGEILKLSRETVRMLEETALEKLSSENVAGSFQRLLRSRTRMIMDVLGGEARRLDKQNLKERQSLLPADDLFLILALHGSIENWLNANFECNECSWWFPAKKTKIEEPQLKIRGVSDLSKLNKDEWNYLYQLLKEKESLQTEVAKIDLVLADYSLKRAESLLKRFEAKNQRKTQAEERAESIRPVEDIPATGGLSQPPQELILFSTPVSENIPVQDSEMPAMDSELPEVEPQMSAISIVPDTEKKDEPPSEPESNGNITDISPSAPVHNPEQSLKAARAFLGLE